MSNRRYIGTIDLTARLSSMNPYMYDDPKDANLRFEKILIEVCRATYLRSSNQGNLRRDGVIKGGDVPAGFEFEHLEDFIFFIGQARWALLDAHLPFKLCASLGTSVGRTMEEMWSARVAEGSPPFSESIKAEAKARFGTDDPKQIALIMSLYRPAAATDDSALLKTSLEEFKGFGLHINKDLIKENPEIKNIFLNYCPIKSQRGYDISEYYDMYLPISPQDTIQRYDNGENRLTSGCGALISQVLDMMRRSMKADDQNGAYYISLLNCFAHSSSYDKLAVIEETRASPPRGGPNDRAPRASDLPVFRLAYLRSGGPIPLAAPSDGPAPSGAVEPPPALKSGWQGYPPIFETVLLSPQSVSLLKRAPGAEILLGSMMMRIHERAPSDAVLEGVPRGELATDPEKESENTDPILERTIRTTEAIYGERIMRKILRLPPHIVSQAIKKEILKIGNLNPA